MDGTVTIPVDEYNRMRDKLRTSEEDAKKQKDAYLDIFVKLSKIGVKYKTTNEGLEFYFER
jgi:hypothetical protein